MKTISILFFLSLTALLTKAQSNLDSTLAALEDYKKDIFNSNIFLLTGRIKEVTTPTSKTYESQGMYHSTYLILNTDSSYIYYSLYEVGFDLTVGRWTQTDTNKLALNWDKERTLGFIKDEKKYRRYSKYAFPLPVPMTNWLIKISKNKLEPSIK